MVDLLCIYYASIMTMYLFIGIELLVLRYLFLIWCCSLGGVCPILIRLVNSTVFQSRVTMMFVCILLYFINLVFLLFYCQAMREFGWKLVCFSVCVCACSYILTSVYKTFLT